MSMPIKALIVFFLFTFSSLHLFGQTEEIHINNVERMIGVKNVQPVIAEEQSDEGHMVKTLSLEFFEALPEKTQALVLKSKYYKIEEN